MLVSGLVIFFPVVRGGSKVRVCGKFVVFGSFMVRVNWHSASNPCWPLQLRIFPFSKLFNCEHSRAASAACLINALIGEVKFHFTSPVIQLHRQWTANVGVEAGNRFRRKNGSGWSPLP